ncbi:MAG: T9SS type A sorting domain-containing protein [Bacteroidia bacterium]
MHKNLVVLTFLILTTKFIKGQTSVYYPFPDSNIIWVQSERYATNYSSIDTCFLHTNFNLYIAGDTISGTYTYHKVYANWHRWGEQCPPAAYDAYGMYMYAFRQDITNKKVYLLDSGIDRLAYNFDLEVGDTLNTFLMSNINYVQSIDSILVAGQYRKRFWLNHDGIPNYAALIEGVGTTFGAFVPVHHSPILTNSLLCVKINDEFIWSASQNNSCSLTYIPEKFVSESTILVYPNPVNSELTIEAKGVSENAFVEIKNLLGQTFYSEQMTASKIVDMTAFPNGIYLVQVHCKGSILSNKIIKQ